MNSLASTQSISSPNIGAKNSIKMQLSYYLQELRNCNDVVDYKKLFLFVYDKIGALIESIEEILEADPDCDNMRGINTTYGRRTSDSCCRRDMEKGMKRVKYP